MMTTTPPKSFAERVTKNDKLEMIDSGDVTNERTSPLDTQLRHEAEMGGARQAASMELRNAAAAANQAGLSTHDMLRALRQGLGHAKFTDMMTNSTLALNGL